MNGVTARLTVLLAVALWTSSSWPDERYTKEQVCDSYSNWSALFVLWHQMEIDINKAYVDAPDHERLQKQVTKAYALPRVSLSEEREKQRAEAKAAALAECISWQ